MGTALRRLSRGRTDAATYAGHHFVNNPRRLERQGFFGASTKYERIAALETDHHSTQSSLGNEGFIDLVLLNRIAAAFFADVDEARVGANMVEHRAVHDAVVDDDVGGGE